MIPLLVNKLVKNIAADATLSQLCIVDSHDKQQQATTPSAITMDAIKVTTNRNERNQCHHREASKNSRKTSPLNATRKAAAISFKATSGLADERNKKVVRAL